MNIESSLLPRLGIHIRTDGIQSETFSEVMLMYNAFATEDENFGVSVFGQVSVIKKALPPVVVFNGDIHYDPEDNRAEYETSLVIKAYRRR